MAPIKYIHPNTNLHVTPLLNLAPARELPQPLPGEHEIDREEKQNTHNPQSQPPWHRLNKKSTRDDKKWNLLRNPPSNISTPLPALSLAVSHAPTSCRPFPVQGPRPWTPTYIRRGQYEPVGINKDGDRSLYTYNHMHADMHLCIYVGINTYKYEHIDTPVYATLYKSIHRYTCAFADRWVHVYKIYNITIDCFVCKKCSTTS